MDDSTALLLTFIIVGAIFFAIYQLDRRFQQDGSLFARPPSGIMRVFTGLLGLGAGAFFSYEFTSSHELHFDWLIVSLALLAYSLGASNLLLKSQQGQRPAPAPTPGKASALVKQVIGLLFILGAGLACIAGTVYGSLWILQHPQASTPILIVLAIGFAALIPLRYLATFWELYQVAKKDRSNKKESK